MNGHDGGINAERQMLLLALKSYSDSCELPELSPECPFYEMTPRGPMCGEQCLDIIAEHRADMPARKVLDLGDGMAVYARPARKARRGPEPTARPFDAAVFQARDQDKPTDEKHTVSLIKDIADLVAMPPQMADDPEERGYLIRASIDELVSRGFRREDLLLAVAYQTSVNLTAWLVVGEIITNGVPLGGGNTKPAFEVPDEWRGIAQGAVNIEVTDTSSSITLGDFDALQNSFLAWSLRQDLDSLVTWAPLPSPAFRREHARDSHDTEFVRANWIKERFTETYPDRWSTPSLDMEWKYLHGSEVACCDSAQMKLRRVGREDIAVVIAERAVDGRGRGGRRTGKFRVGDFTETAIGLLSSGKQDSAAAMYEALHKLDPSDPEIMNNLGFCLIPADPERALWCLNESTALSPDVTPVTWANKVAALYLLGRDSDALVLARQGCEGAGTVRAWLWLIEDPRKVARLGTDINVGEYVKDLESRLVDDLEG
jgi:hypothetical protein